MPEESTTPDLVGRVRGFVGALNRGDPEEIMSFFALDVVWESKGLGTSFEGEAIRRHSEDWRGAYEEYEMELEEVLDLGSGVVLVVIYQGGRPIGSTGHVRVREAWVYTWVEGMLTRVTTYLDVDEARSAAERLVESRG